MKNELITFYLDWVNCFLTVEHMADRYGITTDHCNTLISMGRQYQKQLSDTHINKTKTHNKPA